MKKTFVPETFHTVYDTTYVAGEHYNFEITSENGEEVERFFFKGDQLIFSIIKGKKEDFMKVFQPKVTWYYMGKELRYVIG